MYFYELILKFVGTIQLLLYHASYTVAWDADAGIVQSLTKGEHVTVTATSSVNFGPVEHVIDNNDNTNWVSNYCLPSKYFKRNDLNVLLGACATGRCIMSSGSRNDTAPATDGTPYTMAHVYKGNQATANFSISLQKNTTLKVITVNALFRNITVMYARDSNHGLIFLRTFLPNDSHTDIQILNATDSDISSLVLESSSDFGIKEIAAMGHNGCVEQIIVDLGSVEKVGTVKTRHWAGTNAASGLFLKASVDGVTWTVLKSLNPDAVHAVTSSFTPLNIRYIALEYHVNLQKYKKVYCYEIDAWDENGIWGSNILPKPQDKTLREILGVNGIWGWGHNTYSDTLLPSQGPSFYKQIASHARNYHNLNWDVKDPDFDPEFDKMASGKGTNATWWLNWDKEYGAWKAANLYVDVSIQFTNKTTPQYKWNTPEQSAYNYGQAFARHFGSVHGNGLVDAVEVGNEPWDYDAAFYFNVLKGMSKGIRSVDSNMVIIPATFQAEDKSHSNTYIGSRVLPEVANDIDVINCHTYSFVNDQNGVRHGTYPENRESTFNNIRPITRWRDANVPSNPIWVTEWGWDSSGEGENCSFTECVSEQAQAVYALRGFLILARSNIKMATWFFYANTECSTLFCRSGLTTSVKSNFIPKTVFFLLQKMLNLIGDKYFLGVIQENDEGYIYAFSKSDMSSRNFQDSSSILQHASHIVGWLPIDISDRKSSSVNLQLPDGIHATHGIRFTGVKNETYSYICQHLALELRTEPVLYELVHGTGGEIVG